MFTGSQNTDTPGYDVVDWRAMVTAGVTAWMRWWRKPDVQQQLNLTKSQVERLDTVFEKDRPERVALRRKIAEMDRLLRRILERGNAEDATVKRMSEQVEALRAQHNVRRTLMRFAIYRRLTQEQRTTLAQLRRADSDIRSGPDRDSDR